MEKCQRGEILGEKVYVPPLLTQGKCPECGGVGFREYWKDGYRYTEQCSCYQKRITERAMEKSGINERLKFENFVAKDDYQKRMRSLAEDFVQNGCEKGSWFYIGGQPGSGKTHICTAIINQLIQGGQEGYYMTWPSEARCLKAKVTAAEEYDQHIRRICNVQILYIDDFLKTNIGTTPSPADINLSFQIINSRYQNKNLVTIFSSELALTKMIEMNEAIGSRIYEKCGKYLIFNEKDMNHNYRLSKVRR